MQQSQNKLDRSLPTRILEEANDQDLILNQKFTYNFFQRNRYTISQNGNYESLCNNGFIKLYSKLCRVYWHAQNQFSHQVPDWKFHISVSHQHLKSAWNLIAALFFKYKCRAGMKVIYLKEANNTQKGRQITLYIIKYDSHFKNSEFASDFGLDIDVQHSQKFWLEFCIQIQQLLNKYDINSNGIAEGDHPLGKYISIRNEAFVKNQKGQNVYPPNQVGWNSLSHQEPIRLNEFKKALYLNSKMSQMRSAHSKISLKILLIVGVIVTAFWVKLKWKSCK